MPQHSGTGTSPPSAPIQRLSPIVKSRAAKPFVPPSTTATSSTPSTPAAGVTFGGAPLYIPGPNYFTLSMGIAPGSGTVTMLETDLIALQAVDDGLTLEISDGTRTLKIEDLYIRDVQHQDPVQVGDAMVQVLIEDKRSRWSFGDLYGTFNKLREDGISYVKPSTNDGTPFTFDEILQKVIDEIDGLELTPNTEIDFVPNDIAWEGNAPNSMFQALLGQFGWDIALRPDGAVELVDLFRTSDFQPPDGFTVWGDTNEERDRAHLTPGTLKLITRIFREEETDQWEAVLQHDDKGVGTGEWGTVAEVLIAWGITEGFGRATFYKKGDTSYLFNRFGKGDEDLGRTRLSYWRGSAYRFWRFTDTDRDKKLPFTRMRGKTGTATDRQTALGPQVVGAQWHVQRQAGFKKFFKNVTAKGEQTPWGLRVVDGREGIIHIRSTRPLAHVEPIGGSEVWASGFGLKAPKPPTIRIGYYKKFSDDGEDDFRVRTRDVEGDNNGLTSTRLDPRVVVREVSTGGGFTAENGAQIDAAADNYLREWERRFTIPQPRQIQLAGIWADAKLDANVRSINFRWESGVETTLRLWSDRTPDRYGLGFSWELRAKNFAAQADAARLVLLDSLPGSGAGLPTHGQGALGQTQPQLREFAESREWEGGWTEDEPVLLNHEHAGLVVAMDVTPGPSGEKCEVSQKTGKGGAGVTKPDKQKTVQISGGPADGVTRSGGVSGGPDA